MSEPRIQILQCPTHGFRAIGVEGNGVNQRITPGKCCGSWRVVQSWELCPSAGAAVAQAITPAWIPGPPTEPGEWWVTVLADYPRGSRREVLAVRSYRGMGGTSVYELEHDDVEDARIVSVLDILAHAPLLRREPWRG